MYTCQAVVYNLGNGAWQPRGGNNWAEVHVFYSGPPKDAYRLVGWIPATQEVVLNMDLDTLAEYTTSSVSTEFIQFTSSLKGTIGLRLPTAAHADVTLKGLQDIVSRVNQAQNAPAPAAETNMAAGATPRGSLTLAHKRKNSLQAAAKVTGDGTWDLSAWLAGLGVPEYLGNFQLHGWTCHPHLNAMEEKATIELTDQKLQDIGISKKGHRRMLLAASVELGAAVKARMAQEKKEKEELVRKAEEERLAKEREAEAERQLQLQKTKERADRQAKALAEALDYQKELQEQERLKKSAEVEGAPELPEGSNEPNLNRLSMGMAMGLGGVSSSSPLSHSALL